MVSAIIEKEYPTAKSFLEALRLTSDEWDWTQKDKPFENPKWFFRGQDNAGYELRPRTWRKENNEFFIQYRDSIESNPRTFVSDSYNFTNIKEYVNKKLGPGNNEETERRRTVLRQIAAEQILCDEFALVADSIGIGIPSAKFKMVESLHKSARIIRGPVRGEDNDWFNERTAIAQHHGVHTRLLDWTRDPLVAIHFATTTIDADTLNAKKNKQRRVAVYAIKESFAEKYPMKTLKVPLSTSPYIHAQSGLFTYLMDGDKWYLDHGKWPSIEVYLRESPKEEEVLRKLTLPITEVPELAALLWMERKSRAHMMPTLDNVWQTLESNLLWQMHNQNK